MADWLGHGACNLEILTTSWICLRQSLVQIFGCQLVCLLLFEIFDLLSLFQEFLSLALKSPHGQSSMKYTLHHSTSSTHLQNRSFHVDRTKTAVSCTIVRAKRACAIFVFKYTNNFLPSSRPPRCLACLTLRSRKAATATERKMNKTILSGNTYSSLDYFAYWTIRKSPRKQRLTLPIATLASL